MKIAQIAPLIESVPPKLYGGTERAVSYLTEQLVSMGHDVTLFATADSQTSSRLVPIVPQGLRLTGIRDAGPYNKQQIEQVRQCANDFDVLHFHTDFSHFPMIRDNPSFNAVTTLHGRLDIQAYIDILIQYQDVGFISISDAQRIPLPTANWVTTIPHGLPKRLYNVSLNPDGYLAFLGRICEEKGIEPAIDIARRSGHHLKIAAKIDPVDQAYFEAKIKPLLGNSIEFIGEIGDHEKQELLGGANAVLFPVTWPEPFGLVMIEAMACGTPVIGSRLGSVPEVITHGVSGYVVDDIESAVSAITKLDKLDRQQVRQCFDARFTVEREAIDYLAVYHLV